ncbi:IS21-like element helper ATPase IstB [Nitrosomonas sp. Nm58]|uniref:IS21-like element helper ATPase IstB n=1 Tax=Nitrosomonas sp. Nm58 TaxID=200126 RepID=UPI000894844F|nr:IS21-like element helper ATPase IstB [Nitrosomonas sp. Nm58]SDZ13495.1 DNA replication protein DnaC [Nitrosomonas sp. Nm58]
MSSINSVAQKYRGLCLSGIAEQLEQLLSQAQANDISYLQFAEALVVHEHNQRNSKRIEQNRKRAAFPLHKSLEEFDYRFQTTISKREINSLLDFSFIDNRENVVFIGPPGVGKTHLAIGIGLKAIDAGYKVCFTTALGLMETLELAELKGELKKKINQLLKFDVLIIDELGYLPMNEQGMHNLFQLINAFYEYCSVILTTNKEFTNWSDFFVDVNVAVPIVDRLIHHSHIFMLGGESYRLKTKLNN